MAYADKLTTTQRVAIISNGNGNILAEGCIVEGETLLKEYTYPIGSQTLLFKADVLEDWVSNRDAVLVILDKEEKRWEPRVHTEEFKNYQDDTADEYPELRSS